MIRCLFAWFHRREPDLRAFGYGRGVRPLVHVLLALTIVEGLVVEVVLAVLLHGTFWPWLLLAAHIYGLLWILGLLASFTVRPHLLGPDTLLLRDSAFTELAIPLSAITSVMPVNRANVFRSGLQVDGDTALLAYGDANVALRLDPVGDPRLAGVATLHITVDARERFLAAWRVAA